MTKWTDVVEMKFELELLDGMRIGGAGGGLEIGGVDPNLMALKDPISGLPYIAGSSLKGKLRSTLEKEHGRASGREPCECGEKACRVCPIFGAHKPRREAEPSRLVVRDAHFSTQYAQLWNQRREDGLQVFEVKTEVTSDRQRGVGFNPRTQERVPAGAVFEAEMVLKIFDCDDQFEGKWIADLKNALAIVQRCDSLGAGGSRGSGRIAIRNFRTEKVKLADLTL